MFAGRRFQALFCGGPLNGQQLIVHADPDVMTFEARPALYQEFERALTNRHGEFYGRVGVFLYRMSDPPGANPSVWCYTYLHYGEKTVDELPAHLRG